MKERTTQSWFILEREDIKRYIVYLNENGYSKDTVRKYSQVLEELYDHLPENKSIYPGIDSMLLEGVWARYSVSATNVNISIYNNFMQFLHHKELQIKRLPDEPAEQPKLTRDEYFRLLAAAKVRGERQAYLLIKLFGNTGLFLQDLKLLTVEAVRDGVIYPKGEKPIWIPELLQEEMIEYASNEGILSGPVFCTRNRTVLDRQRVHRQISALSEASGVDKVKATPRCLRGLYKSMMDELYTQYEAQVKQSYANRLQMEQSVVGWTDGRL